MQKHTSAWVGIGAAALILLAATAARAEEAKHPHWSYEEGAEGPAHWGRLQSDFRACEVGHDQSPINLTGAVPARLAKLAVAYQAQPLVLLNNGHTIQVNAAPGNGMEMNGERYELLQYHFHTPSEHAIAGQRAPMELHLVHKGTVSGKLAVVGVMMMAGAAHPAIGAIWAAMPVASGPEVAVPGVTINPASLLPDRLGYFCYEGSLTTPPCSETVQWINLQTPIEVSQEQLAQFAGLFPMNARPLMPLNRRFVLSGGDE